VTTLQWLQLVTGAMFAVAGLIASYARPGNRIGPAMIAYGLGNALGRALLQTYWPPAVTVGIILMDTATISLVYLLLAFPSGHLRSRRDWLILGPVIVVFVPLELAWMSFFALGDGLNLLAVWPDAEIADAIDWVQRIVLTGASLALVIVVVRRWWLARGPSRRVLAPVLAGVLAVAAGTFNLLWDKVGGPRTDLIVWVTALTILALPAALLINLLRARLARSAVGSLLIDLRENDDPAHLRDALADALRDPGLALAFWVAEYETYADLDGNEVELPQESDAVAVTLLERPDGTRVAALIHDPSLREEGDLLPDVAAAAAIAMENARLQAELRARLEELRGSRVRVIEAADTERRRLERDLHDGAQRRLVTLSMSLGMLEHRLADDPEARQLVSEAKAEAVSSLQDLRDLARGIHPAVLTSHGLEVALESLAASSPVPVGVDIDLLERLPSTTEVAAYYLICEALTNTAKHAHASSATVSVRRDNGTVHVEVADDGVGGADTGEGSGLRGLADRVEALDGRLRVFSPLGAGTRLEADIPCASS
jgi:signal transduction histidine kinase